ncbi:hypothetical protein ACFLSS_02665 [Bacteroidota bacterium]
MRYTLSAITVLSLLLITYCDDNSSKVNRDDELYTETEAPNLNPELYLKGFISTGLSERDAAFSADGNEFYYTLWAGSFGVIVLTKKENDVWTKPEVVSFSHEYSNLEPFITADGTRLFFASNRPTNDSDETEDYNIWFVEKTENNWSKPEAPGLHINTDANEFYPSLADNGNLYYTARYENSIGGEDIWMCKFETGKYLEPINLGKNINSETDEFNAFISPDESFLIYSSWNREGGYGSGDLYISFKDQNNEWKSSINLGDRINSNSLDYCPFVSRDGKVFFFTSRKLSEELDKKRIRDFDHITGLLNDPQNGQNDIYWMKASFIDSLRAVK